MKLCAFHFVFNLFLRVCLSSFDRPLELRRRDAAESLDEEDSAFDYIDPLLEDDATSLFDIDIDIDIDEEQDPLPGGMREEECQTERLESAWGPKNLPIQAETPPGGRSKSTLPRKEPAPHKSPIMGSSRAMKDPIMPLMSRQMSQEGRYAPQPVDMPKRHGAEPRTPRTPPPSPRRAKSSRRRRLPGRLPGSPIMMKTQMRPG